MLVDITEIYKCLNIMFDMTKPKAILKFSSEHEKKTISNICHLKKWNWMRVFIVMSMAHSRYEIANYIHHCINVLWGWWCGKWLCFHQYNLFDLTIFVHFTFFFLKECTSNLDVSNDVLRRSLWETLKSFFWHLDRFSSLGFQILRIFYSLKYLDCLGFMSIWHFPWLLFRWNEHHEANYSTNFIEIQSFPAAPTTEHFSLFLLCICLTFALLCI